MLSPSLRSRVNSAKHLLQATQVPQKDPSLRLRLRSG